MALKSNHTRLTFVNHLFNPGDLLQALSAQQGSPRIR